MIKTAWQHFLTRKAHPQPSCYHRSHAHTPGIKPYLSILSSTLSFSPNRKTSHIATMDPTTAEALIPEFQIDSILNQGPSILSSFLVLASLTMCL
jgi:hypothetical protein